MAISSHIHASSISKAPPRNTVPTGGSSTSFGRVIHVVLSQDDPYCKDPSMVNGVYYRPLGSGGDESDILKFPFAYQGNTHNRTIPLPKEIVKLQREAGIGSLQDSRKSITYWKEVVNIWNNPHHNAAPDTSQTNWEEDLLKGFPERKDINPLKANPGDTLIEGRLGQSIRLGNIQSVAGDVLSTSPTILISNGQIKTDNGIDLIEENINEDFNSLYFLSNHQTILNAASNKQNSYLIPPLQPSQYKGNQVILNGGRVVINAKEESILLFSKDSIGLSSSTLNLDGKEYVCVDADKIYLGEKSLKATTGAEPVVRGIQLELWLTDLLNMLDELGTACTTAPTPQLRLVGPQITQTVLDLKTKMASRKNSFKSPKVFVE